MKRLCDVGVSTSQSVPGRYSGVVMMARKVDDVCSGRWSHGDGVRSEDAFSSFTLMFGHVVYTCWF
ncbi:unnamed protein product [Brassica napus]|uniref:(rape) hypothetical protein n=1 Tax=Brassica napus TaxID=3708 RepID=A0A816NPU7_BRANA|nr:unnamed protein product [Brassica napus]